MLCCGIEPLVCGQSYQIGISNNVGQKRRPFPIIIAQLVIILTGKMFFSWLKYHRPISCTYWASLLARHIRLWNNMITQAAHIDIDRIIRAIWFDIDTPLLERVRCSATCSSLSWLLPPMGMQHACLLLEHIGGRMRWRAALRARESGN